jgi:hypothetical protein
VSVSLVHNEQTKLTATWLNGIAIASIAVGGIAPFVAAILGTSGFVPAFVTGGDLVDDRSGPTLDGETDLAEVDRMTGTEIYAFFISPLLVGAVCLLMIWLTGREDRRNAPKP